MGEKPDARLHKTSWKRWTSTVSVTAKVVQVEVLVFSTMTTVSVPAEVVQLEVLAAPFSRFGLPAGVCAGAPKERRRAAAKAKQGNDLPVPAAEEDEENDEDEEEDGSEDLKWWKRHQRDGNGPT